MAKQKVTSFCANWQDMVFTNIDGVEEKYNWVKPNLGDPHKVRCDKIIFIFGKLLKLSLR